MEKQKAYISIQIPDPLCYRWPKDRGGGDTSPPHITVVYVGECTPDQINRIKHQVAQIAQTARPFPIHFLPGVYWFQSHTGEWIAHKKIDAVSESYLRALHYMIKTDCENIVSRPCGHVSGNFLVHSTLKYCDTIQYNGPIPEGGFLAYCLNISYGDDSIDLIFDI